MELLTIVACIVGAWLLGTIGFWGTVAQFESGSQWEKFTKSLKWPWLLIKSIRE